MWPGPSLDDIARLESFQFVENRLPKQLCMFHLRPDFEFDTNSILLYADTARKVWGLPFSGKALRPAQKVETGNVMSNELRPAKLENIGARIVSIPKEGKLGAPT